MAQPNYHILKTYANGVMDQKGKFYPFTKSAITLDANPRVRYYIHSIQQNWAGTAAVVAANYASVTAIVENVATTLAYLLVPQTTAAIVGSGSQRVEVGVLCDQNTAVTIVPGATTPTACTIVYAVIDEKPGEYTG